MKLDRRNKIIIAAGMAPAVILFSAIKLFKIEAVWLFAYFTFIDTLLTLLLASTFVGWKEKPEYKYKRYQPPKPRFKL